MLIFQFYFWATDIYQETSQLSLLSLLLWLTSKMTHNGINKWHLDWYRKDVTSLALSLGCIWSCVFLVLLFITVLRGWLQAWAVPCRSLPWTTQRCQTGWAWRDCCSRAAHTCPAPARAKVKVTAQSYILCHMLKHSDHTDSIIMTTQCATLYITIGTIYSDITSKSNWSY